MTGFLCFLLFLAGIALAALSAFMKRHRHGLEITGHLLISAAFFIYALVSTHQLRTAPRPVVTGTVIAKRLARSRMDSNDLTLQPESGSPRLTLHSDANILPVQIGDQVHVQYLEADNGLLELDILAGSQKGYRVFGEDGAMYHLLYLLGAVIFLATAIMLWRRSRKVPVS
jgi:hypothetical protein